MPRAAVRAAALLLATAATLTGCTAGPSDRPTVGLLGETGTAARPSDTPLPSPVPLPPLEEQSGNRIDWADCTEDVRNRLGQAPRTDLRFECGQFTSLLDSPSNPGQGVLRVAVLRVGSGPVPLVVVNDSAGEPGTLHAARMAAQVPPQLLERFSLIGMDRRGTGASDPVECVDPELRRRIVAFDLAPVDSRRLSSLHRLIGQATQECLIDLENRLPAYDSWRAAGDLDQLRRRLGVSRLNAIGRGDGSQVLTMFVERYPHAVGRFVLDGVPDGTTDAIGQADGRATAAEQVFDAFAADCTSRPGCPLGANPEETVRTLLAQLRQRPLSTPGIEVSSGVAAHALLIGLSDRSRWTELAQALAQAQQGDGKGLAELVRPLVLGGTDDPPRFDGALANACNDTTTRVPLQRLEVIAEEWINKYPLFGSYFAQQLLLCVQWPSTRPLPQPLAAQAPPILVLGTALDPVTPLPGTTRTAEQLTSGVLVTWQGNGHGAFPTSPCVTAAVQGFLVEGKVPSSQTVCPP